MKNLDSSILQLCGENKKIDAILLVQRESGLSLQEATSVVERVLRGRNVNQTPAIKNSDYSNIKPVVITVAIIGIVMLGLFLKNSLMTRDIRPKSQIEFESNLVSLQQDARLDNNNEVKRDQAAKEQTTFMGNRVDITDWCGEVIDVEKTMLNGNGIRIKSDPGEGNQGNLVSYYLKGINDNQLSELKQGNKIRFSGTVSGSDILSLQGAISSIFNQDIVQVQSASVTLYNK